MGKKRGGPITRFVDWFMVDPITTGIVLAPIVIMAILMGFLWLLRFVGALS